MAACQNVLPTSGGMLVHSSARRVVITGMGVISPLGNTHAALWAALLEGRSGIAPLDAAFPSILAVFGGEAREFTGEIDGFGPLDGEKKKAIRKGLKVMCRESQMGVAAAQRADQRCRSRRRQVPSGADRRGVWFRLHAHHAG